VHQEPIRAADEECKAELAVLVARVAQAAHGFPLDRTTLLEWMASNCPEVREAVFGLLFDPPVDTTLPDQRSLDEFFFRHLFDRLRQDVRGDPTSSRYLAADDLRAWFQRLWRQNPRPAEVLAKIRSGLADLVRNGDQETREAVLLAVLEHVFQDSDVVDFFDGWRADPVLRKTFDEALYLSD
jgi:hypothetical protein